MDSLSSISAFMAEYRRGEAMFYDEEARLLILALRKAFDQLLYLM